MRNSSHFFSERVLLRLEQAEHFEPNPHFRDDYRIAWIAVLRAARCQPLPMVVATYTVIGLHPDKVWPATVARRKALLGPWYEEFWGYELPPRKPPVAAKLQQGCWQQTLWSENTDGAGAGNSRAA